MDKPRILFIGAMDREIRDLIAFYKGKRIVSLNSLYPMWLSKGGKFDVYILQTHVGDTNAAIATTLALSKHAPDYVFKIGCVGGNSQGLHTGDLLLPLGFFHSGSWITRSRKDNTATSDASLWQPVFGEKPYQVNSENLGNQPYFLKPNDLLNTRLKTFFTQKNVPLVPCYIGGGNMWFFDADFMKNVSASQIPGNNPSQVWGADMESYAIASACRTANKPFTGFYRISNSDYYNEPYLPADVAKLFDSNFVQKIDKFLDSLAK